jgi:hypothetical protein
LKVEDLEEREGTEGVVAAAVTSLYRGDAAAVGHNGRNLAPPDGSAAPLLPAVGYGDRCIFLKFF